MRIPQRGEQGFTLVELLIVIVIIGVLAAIAIPIFLSQSDNANAAAAEAEASSLETLIATGISVNGTVTTVTDGTTITVPNVGSMTITDGTMTVSGADSTDYCALVTVGTSTAAYGPGANATNTGCAPTVTVPDAPTAVNANAGSSQVTLTWTAPANDGGAAVTDYVVQYRTTAGPGAWTTFADGTNTNTTATVTGLANGTGYDFQVAAVNSVGTGAYSTSASATPEAVAPLAPTVTLSQTGPVSNDLDGLLVSWDDVSADSYTVKVRVGSPTDPTPDPYTTYSTVGGGVLSQTISFDWLSMNLNFYDSDPVRIGDVLEVIVEATNAGGTTPSAATSLTMTY